MIEDFEQVLRSPEWYKIALSVIFDCAKLKGEVLCNKYPSKISSLEGAHP